MEKKILSLSFLALLLEVIWLSADMGYIHSPWQSVTQNNSKPLGVLLQTKKEVRRKQKDGLLWEDATKMKPIFSNDSILTLNDSGAEIQLDGDSAIKISENTLIKIDSPTKADEPLRLVLKHGSAKIKTSKSQPKIQIGNFIVESKNEKQEAEIVVTSNNQNKISLTLIAGAADVKVAFVEKTKPIEEVPQAYSLQLNQTAEIPKQVVTEAETPALATVAMVQIAAEMDPKALELKADEPILDKVAAEPPPPPPPEEPTHKLLPPPAPVVQEPEHEVRAPAAIEDRPEERAPIPEIQKPSFAEEGFKKSFVQVDFGRMVTFSNIEPATGQSPAVYGTLTGKGLYWYDENNGMGLSAKSKVTGFNTKGKDNSITVLNGRYYHRWLMNGGLILSGFGGVENSHTSQSSTSNKLYSDGYTLLQLGGAAHIAFYEKWEIGTELSYGFLPKYGSEEEAQADIYYFFQRNFLVGIGYRFNLFNATKSAAPDSISDFHEGSGESFISTQFLF